MTKLSDALYISSLDELRSNRDGWDDLWWRSDESQPTARAELIHQWVECFQYAERFCALVLTDGPRFMAALPLVKKRKAKLISTYDIPGNEWSSAGMLLLDPDADRDELCTNLLAAMNYYGIRFGWFSSLPFEAPSWQALLKAGQRSGWLTETQTHGHVPYLVLNTPWENIQSRWSKNFRRQLRRAINRLQTRGKLEFELLRPTSAQEALAILNDCFQLEHRGWKGTAATSVLSHLPARMFFERQAQQLAQWHQLQVALLKDNGRLIAYDYGWFAKSVYHSVKIGYALEYARQSPGQVLTMLLIERLCADDACRKIDFIGPMTRSLARWRPRVYTEGRLAIAFPDFVARSALFVGQVKDRWRRTSLSSEQFEETY